jgi:hypothetical protein
MMFHYVDLHFIFRGKASSIPIVGYLSQKISIGTFIALVSERVLWLVTGLKALLYVNRVKINPQRYFKKTGIIVWNAGKNKQPLLNKAVVQSQAEEPLVSYAIRRTPSDSDILTTRRTFSLT